MRRVTSQSPKSVCDVYAIEKFGRGEWIRTTDLLVPNLMMTFSENAQNSMTSKLLQVKGLCRRLLNSVGACGSLGISELQKYLHCRTLSWSSFRYPNSDFHVGNSGPAQRIHATHSRSVGCGYRTRYLVQRQSDRGDAIRRQTDDGRHNWLYCHRPPQSKCWPDPNRSSNCCRKRLLDGKAVG
jgi:hypothetical protein